MFGGTLGRVLGWTAWSSGASGTLGCMTRAEFERLVRQALADIPDWIHAHVDNVDVVVDDWPSREQLVGSGIDEGQYLLGLYEGVPLTDRYDYGMVLPDKITLFQRAIEEVGSQRRGGRGGGADHSRPRGGAPLRHRRRQPARDGCLGPRPRSSWYKSAVIAPLV